MQTGNEEIVQVSGEDPAMLAAIHEARQSFQHFLIAFMEPKPNQKHFLVRIRFDEGDTSEHIWLADLELGTEPPTGIVGNEPLLKSVRFMERVPIDFRLLTDWMFYEDECLIGGFTTRLLRPSARPS